MIWIIGNKGMLGTELESLLKAQSVDYLASDIEVDAADMEALRSFSSDKAPDYIINCSAYTNVDKAEDEPEKAFKINKEVVENIARITLEKNATLIHISTDYVFDGQKEEEYTEDDITDPQSVYGKSKLAGEKAIAGILDRYYIFRISWLYGQYGNNFVHTMLRLFSEKDEINVVSDQWGSPTYAKDMSEMLLNVIKKNPELHGIYHFTNDGLTNWYEFAKEIHRLAKKYGLINKDTRIKPVSSDEYPQKAMRPRNSYLSKKKIKQNLGINLSRWQDSLKKYLISKKQVITK